VSLHSNRRSQAAAAAHSSRSSNPEPAPVEIPPGADPDHHLWRNGRLWWIAFTVHRGHQQERVRLSLGTDDLFVARARRDALLALFAQAEELRISLRFAASRGARVRGGADREVA
jgi:hypothetical protein